jgi:hypothetical protein
LPQKFSDSGSLASGSRAQIANDIPWLKIQKIQGQHGSGILNVIIGYGVVQKGRWPNIGIDKESPTRKPWNNGCLERQVDIGSINPKSDAASSELVKTGLKCGMFFRR